MTRLVRVHLGTAPGEGTQSLNQCCALKHQLRSLLPVTEGMSLLIVTDQGSAHVEAVCDADTPGAEEWGRRAAELAPQVWATIATRRRGRER